MDVLPGGITALLYLFVALGTLGLLALWAGTRGGERNAGFATKRRLKQQLSAKAVLKAHEIRPSLTDSNSPAPARRR